MSADMRRKLIWSLMLVLLLYVGFVLFGDLQRLMAELNQWPWVWLPVVIGLTLVNYVSRLLRWHWYLRLLDTPIALADSARIFGVGMLMVMTPGKAGEFLKSYMVKNVAGAPMMTTAPVVLAGPTCDSVDVLYERNPYLLPVSLEIGDEVLIEATGAYTASYSSVGFNGFPPLRSFVI